MGSQEFHCLHVLDNRSACRRMLKKPASKAEGSSATEAYPWGTLQGDGRLRTKLAGFFSILPGIFD